MTAMTTTPPVAQPEPTQVLEPSKTGIPPLRPYVRDIWSRRPFIWNLSRAGLKAEHYNTVIGQLWIILNPLLLAGVYLFLRTVIRPVGSGDDGKMIIDHLIMGIMFYQYAAGMLSGGAASITKNVGFIKNTAFPRAIFPIETTLTAFVQFLPTLAIYLIFHALLGGPFTSALLVVPVLLAFQTLLGFGLGMFFAPMYVYFRDTQSFLPFIIRVWLYASPVLWMVREMDTLPEGVQSLLKLNPLFPFLYALEEIFQFGRWPSAGLVAWAAAWALFFVVVGSVAFLVRERDFVTQF